MPESDADVAAAVDRLGKRVDDVAARVAELARQVELLRPSADLVAAQEAEATRDTAAFIVEELPTAEVLWHPHDTLRWALGQVDGKGSALEFGVATGSTLGIIAHEVSEDRYVAGFDSFEGLPETWRTAFPAGSYAQEPPLYVSGAELVVGLFADTLPEFLSEHDDPIAFAHLDADLYSSTKTVLDLIGDRLAPDAILVFDEYFNFPGWRRHEHRAFREFVERTGRTFDYLAYTGNHQQVVVRMT